jgi:hypothetical protein
MREKSRRSEANGKSIYSDRVKGNVVLLLIIAVIVADIGYIVTFGKAALELVFVLRDYLIALTDAVERRTPETPGGVSWEEAGLLNRIGSS